MSACTQIGCFHKPTGRKPTGICKRQSSHFWVRRAEAVAPGTADSKAALGMVASWHTSAAWLVQGALPPAPLTARCSVLLWAAPWAVLKSPLCGDFLRTGSVTSGLTRSTYTQINSLMRFHIPAPQAVVLVQPEEPWGSPISQGHCCSHQAGRP